MGETRVNLFVGFVTVLVGALLKLWTDKQALVDLELVREIRT